MSDSDATMDMGDAAQPPLHLYEGYGIELEYMIVSVDTLDPLPYADRVLRDGAGQVVSDLEHEHTAWSNELVLHVLELKTNGPAESLEPLAGHFSADIERLHQALVPHGAQLLPTAMHPWLKPGDTQLWPYEHGPIYQTFNHIFDCRGHGWSNLQSMHLNLPFGDDQEFGKLHAAVRVLLPLLPALAASSPYVEGKPTGVLDNRLYYYRNNSRRVPSVAGRIIPEPIFDRATYEGELLGRIYRDLRPLDPLSVLRHEWVNARGAIARFDRSAIEIRVLDIQEHPQVDLAIAALITAVLRELTGERITSGTAQRVFPTEALEAIFLSTMLEAEHAVIADRPYLDLFGFPSGPRASAQELWSHLLELTRKTGSLPARFAPILQKLLHKGSLARRILRAVGPESERERLVEVYRELGACLGEGRFFEA